MKRKQKLKGETAVSSHSQQSRSNIFNYKIRNKDLSTLIIQIINRETKVMLELYWGKMEKEGNKSVRVTIFHQAGKEYSV